MSILVFANAPEGKIAKAAYEAVFYASKIGQQTGQGVTVVTYGNVDASALSELGRYGAKKVLVNRKIQVENDQTLTNLVVAAAQAEGAKVIIFSFDPSGKAIAPRLSAKLSAGLVAGAIALPQISGDVFTIRTNVFSGKAFAEYEVGTPTKVISLLPNSVKPETIEGAATVEEFAPAIDEGKLVVKERKTRSGAGVPLPEAELVVSAGRGLKGPENWGMVEDLAEALGAATACSRPVSDIGWRPHHEHVGQTGIAIRPNLYIAAGISGAIQHLAGVNGSKTIVVINSDPEAPFFKAADYGIVGDAFEVLPRLTEAVKKFKAAN